MAWAREKGERGGGWRRRVRWRAQNMLLFETIFDTDHYCATRSKIVDFPLRRRPHSSARCTYSLCWYVVSSGSCSRYKIAHIHTLFCVLLYCVAMWHLVHSNLHYACRMFEVIRIFGSSSIWIFVFLLFFLVVGNLLLSGKNDKRMRTQMTVFRVFRIENVKHCSYETMISWNWDVLVSSQYVHLNGSIEWEHGVPMWGQWMLYVCNVYQIQCTRPGPAQTHQITH